MKAFLCLLVCLLMGVAPGASAADKPLTLVLGEDSYPFQFIDDNGEPQGLLVDLWREWSRVNRRPVVFVARLWLDGIRQLESGRADIHLGMAINPERQQIFDFAKPVAEVGTYIYLHKQLQGIDSLSQLQPYQIGVVAGSTFEQELQERVHGLVFREFPSRESLLEAAHSGELVAFAGMEGELRNQKLQQQLASDFPASKRLLMREISLHPAVKKGNQSLIETVNQGFDNISTAVVQDIKRHWLGFERQQRGLVISMPQGVMPFTYVGADGMPHGLFVDMWRLWSEKTGIQISFIPNTISGSIDALLSGKADVHSGYPESEQLNTGLYRAWPLYRVKSRLFVYGKQSTELIALKGKRIGAFPTAPYINELLTALPDTEVRFYPILEEMIDGVYQGDIAGFVAAAPRAEQYLLQNKRWGDFTQAALPEYESSIFVLVRQADQGLASRIAAGFNMISRQEFAELEQKWLLNSRERIFSGSEAPLEWSDNQRQFLNSLGTLKMGYLEHWAPMEFTDKAGQFAGINSDVSRLLATKLNVEIRPIPFGEWEAMMAALQRGDIDLAGSVAKTPEREGVLVYSKPYWPSSWALVSPLEMLPVFNLQQLSGKRLAVIEGYQILNTLMADYPGIKLVLVPDIQTGLHAVADGKADFFIDKLITLSSRFSSGDYQKLKISALMDFSDQQSHIALPSNRAALLPFIDRVLATLDRSKIQEIQGRWLSSPLTVPAPGIKISSAVMVAAVALLLLLIAVIARRLKWEIQARQKAEQQLLHVQSHDPLTQFPNRMILDDRLVQAVAWHAREQRQFALLFVSLNGIGEIRSKAGHGAADDVLLQVASILSEAVRKSDTVARFSTDEFVLILNKIADVDSVHQLTAGLMSRLTAPMKINGQHLAIHASLGTAIFPGDGDSPIALLQHAEQLMRIAQAGGLDYRNTHQ